jgi:D-lactate dehydrogenase
LLYESHVITLHAPLNGETFHMLDRAAFDKCRHGVIVINTARGGLIDTDALADALESGRVAGAGLDLIEEESVLRQETHQIIARQIVDRLKNNIAPGEEASTNETERLRGYEEVMRNQRILNRSDVVFSPHVAFNSIEAVARINALTVANINAFLAGAPINCVPASDSIRP